MPAKTQKPAKKKANKQHDVRGASFLRLAKRVREGADKHISSTAVGTAIYDAFQDLADAIETEGKATSRLR